EVRVAYETVFVDRCRIDDRLGGERLLADVDVTDPVDRIAYRHIGDVAGGTGVQPYEPARAVAHRRGTESGNEEVWALLESPFAEGDPEVVAFLGDAHHRREVEDAAEPEARIEQNSPEGVSRVVAVALKHEVDPGEEVVDVAEDVRYRGADRLGNDGDV